jgi:hypothetical protein
MACRVTPSSRAISLVLHELDGGGPGHKSRTASCSGVGIPMGTSCPARWRPNSRRASRLSVLTLSPRPFGTSEGATTSHWTPTRRRAGAGHTRWDRPHSRPELLPVRERPEELPYRRLVEHDLLRHRHVPVRLQHRHRDRVPRHIQAEMSEAAMRDTGHGRPPFMCGNFRPAEVDDPRRVRGPAIAS